jgi:hypothetical protein
LKNGMKIRDTRAVETALLRRAHGRFVDVGAFRQKYACDVVMVPPNIALYGHQPGDSLWDVSVTPENRWGRRLYGFLRFWRNFVQPLLDDEPIWLQFCYWDAWRERTAYSEEYEWVPVEEGVIKDNEWRGKPGQLPLLSASQPWVACFGAQHGDPSALLLPEGNFLWCYYRPQRVRLATQMSSWEGKVNRAIFAGKDHGEPSPELMGVIREHPRRLLANAVERDALDVDVHFEGGISRRHQIHYKYLIDVNGMVRTWDALWWKLMSGSVMLSHASTWETFFSRQLLPWEHFVPLAADFSDLGVQLEWCQSHDAECRAIAERGRARAIEIYNPKCAAETVAADYRSMRAAERS